MVHRDVKPENLFVTTDGHVKILDFGIATLARKGGDADDRSTVTLPGAVIGTAGYMAPEQVRGEEVDARADVFALGAVFYEMLAGRRAFPGASATESLAAILKEEPSGIALSTPKCRLAWPGSSIAASPSSATSGSSLRATSSLRSRPCPNLFHRLRLRSTGNAGGPRSILGALGVAILTAAATSWVVRRERAPFRKLAAVATRFVVPSVGQADVVVPVLSPDGRRMAYVAARPDGQTALFVHEFDVGEAHAVAAADALAFPFWSPNSRSIAFFSNRQLVKSRQLADLCRGSVRHLAAAAAPGTPRGSLFSLRPRKARCGGSTRLAGGQSS